LLKKRRHTATAKMLQDNNSSVPKSTTIAQDTMPMPLQMECSAGGLQEPLTEYGCRKSARFRERSCSPHYCVGAS